MIKSAHRRYIIILGSAVIIILLIAAFKFIELREKAVTTTTTEQTITQNECAGQQYAKYVKDKLAISQSQGGSLLDRIVAQRRLEEQFCSEFLQCTNVRVSETDAASFVSCLRDQMFRDYYAVPR